MSGRMNVPAAQQMRFASATPRKSTAKPVLADTLLKDHFRRLALPGWSPSLLVAFRILILARFCGAMYTSIADCDEGELLSEDCVTAGTLNLGLDSVQLLGAAALLVARQRVSDVGILARLCDPLVFLPAHSFVAHLDRQDFSKQSGHTLSQVRARNLSSQCRVPAASGLFRLALDPRHSLCVRRGRLLPLSGRPHFASHRTLSPVVIRLLCRLLLCRIVLPALDLCHVGRHAGLRNRHGTGRQWSKAHCAKRCSLCGGRHRRVAFCRLDGRAGRARAVVCTWHARESRSRTSSCSCRQTCTELGCRRRCWRVAASEFGSGLALHSRADQVF